MIKFSSTDMCKEKYEKPQTDTMHFQTCDVICTSTVTTTANTQTDNGYANFGDLGGDDDDEDF